MKGDGNTEKLLSLAMGVILTIYGALACTADHTAKSAKEEEALAVRNWKGEYIGSVQHVLLDSSDGNVAFVILLLHREKREIIIPLRSFSSYDRKNATLVLSVSKEILVSAPEFHLSDLEDPAFVERISRSFGQAPSWTEGVTEGERRI
jgi:PRC-barrel domain protein